jgi:galactose mutarotase-like enzyme
VNVSPPQHKGLHRLASEQLSVDVAARGARITSLKSRLDEREWLAQTKGVGASEPEYGSLFTDADHFGWDEMFPSVDACAYPTDPFAGLDVVDHGELWNITWETLEVSATTIAQRARSERFDYTFERTLDLDGPTLRANYAVLLNETAPAALPFLWALHPQFAMNEGSRVELGGDHTHVIDTGDAASVRSVEWLGDLVIERDVEVGSDRMIYVTPGELIEEARIIDASGLTMRLTWDHTFAPYLGVWMDRGHYTSGRVVAIEPTNGFFDELARAYRSGTVGSFAPGKRVTWWVELNFEQGEGTCANS